MHGKKKLEQIYIDGKVPKYSLVSKDRRSFSLQYSRLESSGAAEGDHINKFR